MPTLNDNDEFGGYSTVIQNAFTSLIKNTPYDGDLAVIYDKNPMEATGYAATIAEQTKEKVWLATFYNDSPDPCCKWEDGFLHVRDDERIWHRIRACFRYVTQKPWNRYKKTNQDSQ